MLGVTDAPAAFWRGRSVLVTGHTGFKGAWLSFWLTRLGARVTGLALPPETTPSLFDQLGLAESLDHRVGDIRDAATVRSAVAAADPDIVLHLAAQPLVLRGYRDPLGTWATNVMGTAHLLDALRGHDRPCAAVIVTTDKVYRNREWDFSYRETDRLGGHDPYSASKAAAELAVDSWRQSFLRDGLVRVASARAGNVIGGGDWSENRIVPDLVRALAAGQEIAVRNPRATRPWQHVLEPLGGYLRLARLLHDSAEPVLQDTFNFGPGSEAHRSVRDLVEQSLRHWPGVWRDASDPAAPHEAGKLALTIDRARATLGWAPVWDFAATIGRTIDWYRASLAGGGDARALTTADIDAYEAAVTS